MNNKLSKLNPGDEVYYDYSIFHIGEKLKILFMNSTQIVCKDNHSVKQHRFDINTGLEFINADLCYTPRIHVVTEDINNKIRRSEILNQIRNTQFERLTTYKLERIKFIIDNDIVSDINNKEGERFVR